MSLSSWKANAVFWMGQRNEERDLHFEQAAEKNKGDCVWWHYSLQLFI